jgi:putative transposase
MRLVTLTHTQRRHAHRGSAGTGHLYQGRFKSFVVQDDTHFLTVSRYVEANALRKGGSGAMPRSMARYAAQ